MSTLTSNDVRGLMEAYQAVYAPQELTEEQVWEEVENWVNSLLKEGYDLSDYTWEEMFEAYVEEQGGRRGAALGNQNVNTNASSAIRNAADNVVKSTIGSTPIGLAVRDMASRMPEPKGSGTRRGAAAGTKTPSPASRPPIGSLPPSAAQPGGPASNRVGSYTSRFAGARDAAFAKAQNIKGSPVVGSRSASPAPARTASPAPTSKPLPPASSTTPAPARPSLSSQADEIRQMRARSLQRQGRTLDAATVSGTTKPAYQANSFDPYDVIKGHLLDEGYADTEEAALAIMSNMSEEWREEILDEAYQEPKFNRKHYLQKLSKGGGMGMGTPEDPHGYGAPKMAKVGAEFVARKTAAWKAQKTGEPDTYKTEREAKAAANKARGAAKRKR